jgi:hypothetical protein
LESMAMAEVSAQVSARPISFRRGSDFDRSTH